ncbi:MAG: protein phosphatase 2C domain-containing protein, partial [Pseudanabaena sp.]
MSTCPSCNAVNPDNYQFCQFCGSKLAHEFAKQTSKSSEIIALLGSESEVSEVKASSIENLDDLEYQHQEINHEFEELVDNAIAIARTIQLTSSPSITDEFSSQELEALINSRPDHANIDSSLKSTVIIPSKHLQNVSYAGKTDVGKERNRNEDDFATIFQTRSIHGKSQISDYSHRGLFILCDGMGGHEGGSEASKMAVNSIIDQFLPFWIDTLPGEKKLNEIINTTNQSIFIKNEDEQRKALGRMGTTLVMLAVHDLNVVIAHVGDSRIYQVANSQLFQLTC